MGCQAMRIPVLIAIVAAVIAVSGVLVFALAPSPPTGSPNASASIYTKRPGTTYYYAAMKIVEKLNEQGMVFNLVIAGGEAEAVKAAASESNIFALVRADTAYYAYIGAGPFHEPIAGLRAVASLHPGLTQLIQIVVRSESGIDSIDDLRGKRVVIGLEGSVEAYTAEKILRGLGVWDDVIKVRHSITEGLYELKVGLVDAVIVVDSVPSPMVMELAETVPIRIIPLPHGVREKLVAEGLLFLAPALIPANAYPGIDRDVQTFAIPTLIVTSANTSGDAIRALLDALFEGVEGIEFSSEHAADTTIKLHPTALAYYVEKGVPVTP